MKKGSAKSLVISAVLVVPIVVWIAGCSSDGRGGYTTSSQYRPGIQTVAVDVWGRGKDVYRRDIEMRVTEAVVKRIEQDTPYKVTVKSRADTLLVGTIDSVEQRTLSFSTDTGLPRETELMFTISFVWKDLRTGKTLVEKKAMTVSGRYTREDPITEDFFQGSENVINRLARQVVEQMEQPW
jgi:hypothetical protein